MITRDQYLQRAGALMDQLPALAALWRVKDPVIYQQILAMATFLSMHSAQQDLVINEPFEKSRDATVLAAAAHFGIMPKSRSGRVRLLVTNNSQNSVSLTLNRELYDAKGYIYLVSSPATIAAGDSGFVEAVQLKRRVIRHESIGTMPYYTIQIPPSDDGYYFSSVSVDGYSYKERFVNTGIGDKVYHLEVDDLQNVFLRFGSDGVVGYQPAEGEILTITIEDSVGVISPEANSPYYYQYLINADESLVSIKLDSVLDKGANPPSVTELRELVKYPSVYNADAVFLGEFEFLARRTYFDAPFLAVWGEHMEEQARVASVDNINTIFIAIVSGAEIETVLDEPNPAIPVAPAIVPSGSWTPTQADVVARLFAADDTYRYKVYTAVKSPIIVSITGTIAPSYVTPTVRQQIIQLLLDNYGQYSVFARRSSSKLLNKDVHAMLRANVQAFKDIEADFHVEIAPYVGANRPEVWRFVAESSITVFLAVGNVSATGYR